MNRLTFLKTIAASTLLLVTGRWAVTPEKYYHGSINIRHLPDGTRAGDWVVIDDDTGRSPEPKDLSPNEFFSIRSCSDMSGWCVGHRVTKYKWKRMPNEVLRGNYTIKYIGNLPRYKQLT